MGISTNAETSLTHTTRTLAMDAVEEMTTWLLLMNSSGRPEICGIQSDTVAAAKI
jgi:hypothetical protein